MTVTTTVLMSHTSAVSGLGSSRVSLDQHMPGRASKEGSQAQGLHAPRAKQAAAAVGPRDAAALQAEPALGRLQQEASAAVELASEAPGPQLADLAGSDRPGLEAGAGLGEDEVEDDPWQIPASHEVLLQGMLHRCCCCC